MSSSEDYLDRLLQQAMQTEEHTEKAMAASLPDVSKKKSSEALLDAMLAEATGQKPVEPVEEPAVEERPSEELENVVLSEGLENGTPISPEEIDAMFSMDTSFASDETVVNEEPIVKEPAAVDAETEGLADDESETEESVTKEFTAEEPIGAEAAAVDTETEGLADDESETEEPVTEEFTAEEPIVKEPAAVETETEAHADDESEAEEPVIEEFAAEEPIEEEAAAVETETEALADDESEAEEPVTESPAMNEPVADSDIDLSKDLDDILGVLEDEGSFDKDMVAEVTEEPDPKGAGMDPVESVQEPEAEPDFEDEDMIEINNDLDIDELLGLKPDDDIPVESHIEEELQAAANTEAVKAPNLEDQDLMDILDVLGDGDDELAEINDILTKDENNEFVAPEHMEALANPKEADTSDASEEETGGKKKKKKEKKGFLSKLFSKKKKGDEEAEADEEVVPLEDSLAGAFAEPENEGGENLSPLANLDGGEFSLDDMLEASNVGVDAAQEEVVSIDPESGMPVEGEDALSAIAEKKPKKMGLIAKLFAMLTEEVEEQDENGVDAVLGEDGIPEKGKGKKKKKGKGKKGKEVSNEDIAAEMDAEDAADIPDKKDKKKKKKEKKPKKEKPVEIEEPGKKLPKKMIIRIFVLCFSILVVLLLVVLVMPGLLNRNRARNAYKNKDYETAYKSFLGNKLNDSDVILMRKSTMMVTLEHKYSLAKAFIRSNDREEALNVLLEGVAYYDENLKQMEELNIVDEGAKRLTLIVDLLRSEFSISEDGAREINAMTSLDYTLRIRDIASGNAVMPVPEDTFAPEDVSENTVGDVTIEDYEPELEDPLESELDH